MYQNKLIELLKELSRREWNAFTDFVNSPTFNKSEKIVQLLAVLKEFWPTFTHQKLTTAYLSAQLFPEKEGNAEKNLSNITTRLLRLLEEFFAFKYWKDDENKKDNDLLRSLIVRNKNELAKLYLDKIAKKRKKQSEKSFDFYDSEVVFFEQKYRHSLQQKKPIKAANLQDNSDVLDEAYILKKLKYACLMTLREKIYKIKHNIGLLHEILDFVETKKLYEKNIAIAIYYTCLKMLRDGKDSEAEKLRFLLDENDNILSQTDVANLFQFIIYFYNSKALKQKADFEKMLTVYDLMLKKGLLNNGKYLHHKNLNNMLICALKAEKFEDAEKLFVEYREKIEPQFTKIVYHFNMGKFAFYQTDYQKADEHFAKIESTTLLYELDRRAYLLKIDVMLNDENNLFEARRDSFKQFLKTNNITKKVIAEYSNFIRFINTFFKLKDLRNKADRSKLKVLQQKIKGKENLREGKWLLQQIKKRLEK